MTLKNTPSPSRRLERAALRAGPAWHAADLLMVATLLIVAGMAVLVPGILADIGDTVVGSTAYIPDLGTSLSSALLAVGRWAVAILVLYTLIHVREAPRAQRVAWLIIACGLLLNLSRNVYTGSPATVSFLVIQAGLCVLLFRLSIRPTVWAQMQAYRERAERAEAELAELRGRR
ncbi:hypothetical protein GCM10017784_35040 [Deinococcus indicus]|uniref:hypothetical protein n=1 Tax=Deinococcus indicus TaxID=223556 RepID=UPI0017482123|nr:hypothetical protein [Deinococcus indicus]GHG37613.1 hypothetical protein GCM10017784_35040 [Deinococcus indicus]